jgi:uncharacterized protein
MNRIETHYAADVRSKPIVERSGGKTRIMGYASVYGRPSQPISDGRNGHFVEVIRPGAFDGLLARNPDVRALANHDPNLLLGRTKSGTLSLRSDDVGLHYLIALADTPVAQHWAESIGRGDIDGSSFSFTTDDDVWDRSTNPPTRTVRSVRDLFDVGPVTYPAYLDATAAARGVIRFDERLLLTHRRLQTLKRRFPHLHLG